jgi:large subunit ribosomal protein L21
VFAPAIRQIGFASPRAHQETAPNMYAVIESGGKQYRVELGTEIEVDRLDLEAGQSLDFERVLLVANADGAAIGRPTVAGARVSADVVRQARGDKIVVFKYRPKARKRTKQGHRADLTILRVSDIVLDGKSAKKIGAAEKAESDKLAAREAEEAARLAAADRALAAKLAGEAAAVGAADAAKAAKAKPAAKATAAPTAKSTAKPTAAAKPKAAAKAAAKPTAAAKPKAAAKAAAKPAAKPTVAKTTKTPAGRTQAPPPAAKTRAPRATKKDE